MRRSWSTSSSSTRPRAPGRGRRRRSNCTRATCCPTTSTSRGPRPSASASGCVYLGLLRATGRWADLLAAEPLDEEAHLRVVHQYVEDGDRGQALRQLDSMAQLWRDELGAEPGAAAQALRAQAEAMSPYDPARVGPTQRDVRAPARDPDRRADRDIVRVLAMLDRHRLVTLLGIGGVGKTRLAAEVAHRYVEATSERACYVDLTKVRDAGLVPELAVRELGIRAGENQDVVQMLEEALRRQSLLLVLDNFEHVVDAADLVAEMVRWSDDLRVLVTSRARLRVAGEKVFEVLPLSVEPEAGRPASRTRWPSSSRSRPPSTRGSSWSSTPRTSRRSAGPWTASRSPSRSRVATSAPCRRRSCAAARRPAGVGGRRRTRPP